MHMHSTCTHTAYSHVHAHGHAQTHSQVPIPTPTEHMHTHGDMQTHTTCTCTQHMQTHSTHTHKQAHTYKCPCSHPHASQLRAGPAGHVPRRSWRRSTGPTQHNHSPGAAQPPAFLQSLQLPQQRTRTQASWARSSSCACAGRWGLCPVPRGPEPSHSRAQLRAGAAELASGTARVLDGSGDAHWAQGRVHRASWRSPGCRAVPGTADRARAQSGTAERTRGPSPLPSGHPCSGRSWPQLAALPPSRPTAQALSQAGWELPAAGWVRYRGARGPSCPGAGCGVQGAVTEA